MKVMAVNSSLRRTGQSVTEMMMNHLVEGMREAGAEVEAVNLRRKRVRNCKGCYTCMTETPGRCMLNDDMTEKLFPIWLESDLVIYATPLFHHTMNALMKTFIERTFPICQPLFRQRKDGKWANPLRYKYPAAVVLAVGGYLEESAFMALSHYANFLWGKGLIAEIYRPSAEFMTELPGNNPNDVLDATRQAGRELVEFMEISPETMARIKQPLDQVETLLEVHNLFWNTCVAEGVTPHTFKKRGMTLLPDLSKSS